MADQERDARRREKYMEFVAAVLDMAKGRIIITVPKHLHSDNYADKKPSIEDDTKCG